MSAFLPSVNDFPLSHSMVPERRVTEGRRTTTTTQYPNTKHSNGIGIGEQVCAHSSIRMFPPKGVSSPTRWILRRVVATVVLPDELFSRRRDCFGGGFFAVFFGLCKSSRLNSSAFRFSSTQINLIITAVISDVVGGLTVLSSATAPATTAYEANMKDKREGKIQRRKSDVQFFRRSTVASDM